MGKWNLTFASGVGVAWDKEGMFNAKMYYVRLQQLKCIFGLERIDISLLPVVLYKSPKA